MSGIRNKADDWQEKCPCCGRFVDCEAPNVYFMWIANAPDFISAFCTEACARHYDVKGGKFITGDGEPYKPHWT